MVADRLEQLLSAGPRSGEAAVEAWRFEVASRETLRVGARGQRLGGPFETPTSGFSVDGWIEIWWSDGLLTRASLDRAVPREFPARLAEWRAMAMPVASGLPLPPATSLPEVETADEAVESLLAGEPGELLAIADRCLRSARAASIGQIDIAARAGRGRRWHRASSGFRAEFGETVFSLGVSAEERYWERFAKRRRARECEIDRLLDRVSFYATRPRLDRPTLPSGMPVLYAPPVVEQLLGRFLGSNLRGRSVVSGLSTYSLADFRHRRAVLRDDIDLVIDTTLPFELASAPCSKEGVPGGRVALIERGRLATPALSLSDARRVGLPPTPAPRGAPRLLLASRAGYQNLDQLLANLDAAVLVPFVLGLRTQTPRSSAYTLLAPEALLIERGRVQGTVSVRIGGHLLSHLRNTSTRFVRFPDQRNPGLLVGGTTLASSASD